MSLDDHTTVSPKLKKQVFKSYEEKGEVSFMKEVLEPLFQNMGFITHFNHGPGEFGKDFMLEAANQFGQSEYTAVVVKKGDIKNTSGGKATLDEVKRQVGQAWDMPYRLLNGTKIKPHKVIVAISGLFSNGAKEEIGESTGQPAYKTNTSYLSSEELIPLVDKHYPTLFLYELPGTAQYLTDLLREIKKYISFSKTGSELLSQVEIKCSRQVPKQNQSSISYEEELPKNSIKEGILTWIQGGTGSGKTHVIKQIAEESLTSILNKESLRKNSTNNIIIPIWIKAHQISRAQLNTDIESVILMFVRNISQAIDQKDVSNWLEKFRVAVFIDEFEKSPKCDVIDYFCENLLKSDHHAVVILSRLMTDTTYNFNRKPIVWSMKQLNISKAVTVIERGIPETNLKARNSLVEMMQNGVMERIPRTPLALTVMSHVFSENTKNTPQNLYEFFDMYFEIVLGRWEIQRDLSSSFDYRQLRSFLEMSAYKMIDQGITIIPCYDLEPIASQVLASVNEKKIKPAEFIERVSQLGDIVVVTNGNFEFTHRTYLEFLAGCEYQNHYWDRADIREKIIDLNWEDCLIFAAGAKQRDDELLLSLESVKEDSPRCKFMKLKNIAMLTQALYQSSEKAKIKAVSIGANSAVNVRDDKNLEESFKKLAPNVSDAFYSLVNLKLFNVFYGRSSIAPSILHALSNSDVNERVKYYLVAALVGTRLDENELAKFKTEFEKISFGIDTPEGLAFSSFIRAEHDNSSKRASIDSVLSSKKFKLLSRKSTRYLQEKNKR